jgi:hypothetical protein
VLKVSVLFLLSLCAVLMIGAVILWSVAQSSGAVGKIEKFMRDLGFTDFRFQGGQIFKFWVFGSLVLVVAGTAFATIMAFLYNLISDLVGGIEISVIEEEGMVAGMAGAKRPSSKKQQRERRPKAPPRQQQPQVPRRTVV